MERRDHQRFVLFPTPLLPFCEQAPPGTGNRVEPVCYMRSMLAIAGTVSFFLSSHISRKTSQCSSRHELPCPATLPVFRSGGTNPHPSTSPGCGAFSAGCRRGYTPVVIRPAASVRHASFVWPSSSFAVLSHGRAAFFCPAGPGASSR